MRRLLPIVASLLASSVSASVDECGWSLTDVASESGLVFRHERGADGRKHLPETMGSGLAWLDADGDGLQDLYVVQSGPFPSDGSASAANALFLNLGGGSFRRLEAGYGADDLGYGQGVAAADYDGDGRVDLFVCNFGVDRLYRNLGSGRFEDVTERAGLGLEEGWSSSAAFADADGDGHLDLYVTRYLVYDLDDEIFCGDPGTGERRYCDPSLFEGAQDRFFRNTGNGGFIEATVDAGLDSASGKGLGVLFTDLDGDGAADLYVSNDLTPNHLFRNTGSGRFEPMSLFSGAAFNADGKAEAGMGLALGDVDRDGDVDLAVSNFDVETNTLYVNDGPMRFQDASARSGFGPPSFNLLGFGAVLADFDRDGELDYYVTNGHIFEKPTRADLSWEQRDLLLVAAPDGRFEERRCGPAFQTTHVGRGLAAGDYDNDGDIDLALVNSGGPLQLLRNEGAGGSWLGLVLVGEGGNTAAIGARVELLISGRTLVDWVTAGDSYQSTSDSRILFGWPRAQRLEKVTVRWPSGHSLELPGAQLEPGTYYTIRESDGSFQTHRAQAQRRSSRTLGVAIVVLLGLAGLLGLAWKRRRQTD